MTGSGENIGKVPIEVLWGTQAVAEYKESFEGLGEEKTLQVVMELQAEVAQEIIIKSIDGESSDIEDSRLDQIEVTWQVWQEEAENDGDEKVEEWIAGMRRDLFSAEG